MNRGQHRRPSAVIEFLKKKPIQLLGIGALAASVVVVSFPYNSYAAPALNSVGTDVPTSYAGTPDSTTDGVDGGTPLYPQVVSPELPSKYQGGLSEAKFYIDQNSALQGPGGTGGAVPAWLLHFDIVKTNSGATQDNNNGYLDIEASMLDAWMANTDGYMGSGSTQEQQFDTFLRSKAEQDYADYSTDKWGTKKYRVYDLSNYMELTGGAFSGKNAGPSPTEGPLMYWTYAPQAQVSVPTGQSIQAGKTFNFDGQAAIQTYHSNYHFEYAQVLNSNGQVVFDSNDASPGSGTKLITFADNYGQSNAVYLNPNDTSSAKFTEVNGGTNYASGAAPNWWYWIDGNGENGGWDSYTPTTHDKITLPSNMANGTYTLKFWVSDWFNRVSSPATTTFTVGTVSNSGITLTASNTAPNVGQSVTLTANVTKAPPAGDTYHVEIYNENGSTLSGRNAQNSTNNVNTYSTSANSQTSLTENYVAYLVDTTTGDSIASNQVAVTWSSGNGGGGNGGGGQCPAPYDKDIYWQSDGKGGDILHWTFDEPYPVYRNETRCSGFGKNQNCWTVQVFDHCADKLTPMQQAYPASLSNGQITAIAWDPGTPNFMWLPLPATQWNVQASGNGFWAPLDQSHGWSGMEQGDSSASQITATVVINGTTYHSYGLSAQTPWAWIRPASGFGFRLLFTGSPHSLPQSGEAYYTITNPSDGASQTWSQKLILNSETLTTEGDQLLGLNDPPPAMTEYVSAWSGNNVPKTVGSNHEPVEWSLSNDWQTALANGAHISVTVKLYTASGTVTYSVPTMVALYSYPSWFFNHIKSVQVGNTTYTSTN